MKSKETWVVKDPQGNLVNRHADEWTAINYTCVDLNMNWYTLQAMGYTCTPQPLTNDATTD